MPILLLRTRHNVDNTDIPGVYQLYLYWKLAAQACEENIRTGREIKEIVPVRFVHNKSYTWIIKYVVGANPTQHNMFQNRTNDLPR